MTKKKEYKTIQSSTSRKNTKKLNFQKSDKKEKNKKVSEAHVLLKNFRHQPDIEGFYRFIHENNLRFEAVQIIDDFLKRKKSKKL